MNELHSADREAVAKVRKARPELIGHHLARDALGLPENVFLHAGPAFAEPSQITRPILNSACAALVFEGVAWDFDSANRLIQSEYIKLAPAQDYNTVVPLAGVVSSSMAVHQIADAENEIEAFYAPLNGGNGPAMRLGQFNNDVIAHLQWVNDELIDALSAVFSHRIDLIAIAADALRAGDDCHGRTIAGTELLLDSWRPQIEKFPVVHEFLSQSPMFFLNLWMAACKCMLAAAEYTPGSSLITTAGSNGFEFGMQAAGMPEKWFTGPAQPPNGDIGRYSASRALGAIGDSAIVDIAGFGAMALALAPEQVKAFGHHVPDDALDLPELILAGVHPAFGDLDFRIGTCARSVRQSGRTPIVALGILDREGKVGRLGGGIFRYPKGVFERICEQLE